MNLMTVAGIILVTPLATILTVYLIYMLFVAFEEFHNWWCDDWEVKTTVLFAVLGIIGAILIAFGVR